MKNDLISFIQRARTQLGASTYLFATVVVIIAGMFVSYLVAVSQDQRSKSEAADFLSNQSLQVEENIKQRIQAYEQILLAGQTLFSINEQVSRSQWQQMIEGLQVERRYPGTETVGFVEFVANGKRDSHIARLRAQGFTNYSIQPNGNRQKYAPVVYFEPFDRTSETFGFDLYTTQRRQEAMNLARDTGGSAMTRPLESAAHNGQQDGVFIFTPIYNGTIPTTVQERRKQLAGFTYTVFHPDEMFRRFLAPDADDDRYGLKIIDAGSSEDTAGNEGANLYESEDYARISQNDNRQHSVRTVGLLNRSWQIDVILDPVAYRGDGLSPPLVFAVGSAASVFIGAFLFILMLNRLGRIAVQHEVELQRTKDELLALASHQLRTPASGVKQYIGMVLQGYAGKIGKEQKRMLDRAYEANDRQLEIINQLLYVAKADAGQLRIEKEAFNFTNLVKEVAEGYTGWAEEQNITIDSSQLKPLRLRADKRYIRMIVENLISNAIKYSFEGGTVRLEANRQRGNLLFVVSDEGVGIEKSDMPLLFQKFTRIDNELSRRVGGSGIGLYLSQELAKAHGGQITSVSEPKKGTTFTLTIPGAVQRKSRSRSRKKSE